MKKVSKNYYATELITDLEVIRVLALQRISVYHSGWDKTVPAAFIQNMQYIRVAQMIESMYLYYISKIEGEKKHERRRWYL